MKSPVLMLAAVALAIAKPPPAHALYDIIGQVFSVSGAPIEAGTVTLERRPGGHDGRLTRLEAAGAFRFVRVSYGMYTLRVSAPAFTGRELQLTLLPSSVTSRGGSCGGRSIGHEVRCRSRVTSALLPRGVL